MANPLSGEGRDDPQASEDRNTKKVRFKEGNKDKAIDMVVDLDAVPTLSSRDKLLGKRVVGIEETNVYLTVQSWTKDFNPLQPYPSVVMAWVRLSRLLSILYKKKILEEIGGMIGKVLVNEAIQQVEFESLMTIYFSCGRHGHVKEMCPKPVVDLN
ncbi:hypothetical protein Gotur_005220 [Gossypium turneri]